MPKTDLSLTEGILQMRLSHTRPVTAATFDEPNLVSAAGLAARTPLLAGIGDGLVLRRCDDTVIEEHGDAKQGAGFGYSKVWG